MDREPGRNVDPLPSSASGARRFCTKCGAALEAAVDFCTKCGTVVPAPALSFDSLPDWWKKAAVGLVGLTVLGVLISSVWPSGAPAVPEEPAAVETAASEPEPASAGSSRLPVRRAPAPRPQPGKQEASAMGDWNVRTEVSPLDDIKTVYLDLKAADSGGVRGRSAYAPQMSLMCTGNKIEAYVFVRSPPEVERSGFATARVRFDALEPQALRMEKSLKEDALFFGDPAALLKEMLGRERMLFGYTPRGSEEVVTAFDLRGLNEAVKPFVEGCELHQLSVEEPGAPEAQ